MSKIKLLLIILITIGISTLSAQWQWVNPLPQGDDLVDVCAIDGKMAPSVWTKFLPEKV